MMDAIRGLENARVQASMPSSEALADQFLEQVRRQDSSSLLARSGLTTRLQKQLAECMLSAELKYHLQTLGDQGEPAKWGNYRNGSTPKSVFTPSGVLELAIPRVRFATFEPRLIPRYQRRLPGFDDSILALYARGLGPEEIRAHLQTLYTPDAWDTMGETITADILMHARQWQRRELEYASAVVYFDAIHVPPRLPDRAKEIPVYFALGLLRDGQKDVFGFWAERTDGPAIWHRVLLELRNRGLSNIRMIAGNHLQGLQESAKLLYPTTQFIHTRHY